MTLAAVTLPGTGFELPPQVLVVGLVSGLTYALLGVGLVLTYRSSRVVNFAHGAMGAIGATLVPILVVTAGLPYAVALPVALATSVLAGAFTELVAVRLLAEASRVVVMVATIGVAQLFFAIESLLPRGTIGRSLYPTPFQASVTVAGVRLGAGELLIVTVVPVVVAALAAFLRWTRVGLAARAAADNTAAARLAGVRVRRVSLTVWTVAGLLAGLSAVLIGPTRPVITQSSLGPSLLLHTLAAAMIGGLTSLRWTFAGGVAVGVLEALVAYNVPTGGTGDIVLFGVVLVTFLARRNLGRAARAGDRQGESVVAAQPALDPVLAASRPAALLRRFGPAVAVALAALAAVPVSNAHRVLLASIVVFAVMGLSLVVLTGFAGQVSLGQFAFVGVGALVGGRLGQLGYPPLVALLYATLAGGALAVVVGLPALRIRGLFLAVTTLAFAVASSVWLYGQPWLVHSTGESTSLSIARPRIGSVDLTSDLHYYWACLVVLVFVAAVVDQLRRTGVGRAMVAVRDNESAAAAMGVSPSRVKLTAFVVSGMIAALAGYLYGGLLGNFTDPGTFAPDYSLTLVALVVLGGITTISGAVLGALWVLGLTYLIAPLLPSLLGGQVALLVSGVGLLGAVLQFPSGLSGAAIGLRDRVLRRLVAATAPVASAAPPRPRLAGHDAPPSAVGPADRDLPALAARDVAVSIGGNRVVAGVTVTAARGEVVGLVGPNGAGKTTLFDVLSGYVRPDAGQVWLGDREVTWLPPERRARLGLGRSFQQARLFDALLLPEALQVALECREPSELVPSLLGLPPSRTAERRKRLRADELVELFGLGDYTGKRIAELSTGVRRLAELACIVGQGARVLLLDEPTAGVAQKEVEAFVPVLRGLRRELDATVVVIEHDIPMVMRLVDRLYVMAAGSLVTSGPPEAVRADPRVVASYLGTDERVIRRSGTGAPVTGPTRRPVVGVAGGIE